MNHEGEIRKRAGAGVEWCAAAAVFAAVLAAQLWLVAAAGTDVPFQDQWDVEGRGLYPAWRDGTWRVADFFAAHNEHRIVWTKALDVALFSVNGQWDPLVQLVAGAVLRALCAGGLAWTVSRATAAEGKGRAWIAGGVTLAFMPELAWHNALWGFQSHVYFSLGFSLLALGLLSGTETSWRRQFAGLAAGGAALLAMGAGALVPVALFGLAGLRAAERRKWEAARTKEIWPAAVLLGAAWALRVEVPAHAGLHARSVAQWAETFLRVLAWPQAWQPLAAWAVNAPLAWVVVARIAGKRRATSGEDLAVLIGGWVVAIAAATAWSRGASGEFADAVPSRYADFVGLLPLANVWCAVVLVREAVAARPQRARLAAVLAMAWGGFVCVGWAGLSAEAMRRIILPRARDREAPVRLAVAFQRTGDAAVFAGQPRLLVPHPNPESVRAVLTDERMRGVLPPSFQPERPMGPLSRAVRAVLGRDPKQKAVSVPPGVRATEIQ